VFFNSFFRVYCHSLTSPPLLPPHSPLSRCFFFFHFPPPLDLLLVGRFGFLVPEPIAPRFPKGKLFFPFPRRHLFFSEPFPIFRVYVLFPNKTMIFRGVWRLRSIRIMICGGFFGLVRSPHNSLSALHTSLPSRTLIPQDPPGCTPPSNAKAPPPPPRFFSPFLQECRVCSFPDSGFSSGDTPLVACQGFFSFVRPVCLPFRFACLQCPCLH